MHDMNAFEQQVAQEVLTDVGPERPIDALAIVRSTKAQDRKWRSIPMLSTLKFVAAAAVVAVFGGFVLAGIIADRGNDEPAPGSVVSPSPAILDGRLDMAQVARPRGDARIIVTLRDAAAPAIDEPLGTWVHDEPARFGVPVDAPTIDFAIDYDANMIEDDADYVLHATGFETLSGLVTAIEVAPVPVITHGNPVGGVEVRLVDPRLVDELAVGRLPQVSGTVMADGDLPDPDRAFRVVVSLFDAADRTVPLAESVLDDLSRLRPPRNYVLEYDPAAISHDGTYLMEARVEDADSGQILGTGGEPVTVIADGVAVLRADFRLGPHSEDAT